MEGWICLYRKFLNWEWYSDANVKILFIHLLLKANYENKVWKNIVIKRGQLVTSVAKLAEETKLTVRQTRCSLDKLKMTNDITIKTTNKYTLVTISNYSVFQDTEIINDKEDDKEIDKQMTNKCQTNGQQHNNKQYINNNNIYSEEEIYKAMFGKGGEKYE